VSGPEHGIQAPAAFFRCSFVQADAAYARYAAGKLAEEAHSQPRIAVGLLCCPALVVLLLEVNADEEEGEQVRMLAVGEHLGRMLAHAFLVVVDTGAWLPSRPLAWPQASLLASVPHPAQLLPLVALTPPLSTEGK